MLAVGIITGIEPAFWVYGGKISRYQDPVDQHLEQPGLPGRRADPLARAAPTRQTTRVNSPQRSVQRDRRRPTSMRSEPPSIANISDRPDHPA
jgi:hypothetical protein